MSNNRRDRSIEAISQLIDLTQSGKIAWEPHTDRPPRIGQPTTPPYYTEHLDQWWRIQGEIRHRLPMSGLFFNNKDNVSHVNLELIDDNGMVLFTMPQAPNLNRLLETVQEQSAGFDNVLEKLLPLSSAQKGGALPLPWHRILYSYKGHHIELVVQVEPGVSQRQLEELSKHLVDAHGAERVSYVDFPELFTSGYTLGYWDTYTGSHLREKDWSKRPEQTDIDLWLASMQAKTLQDTDNPEEEFQLLSHQHNLSVDEVKQRILKVSEWISSGK